MRNSLKTFFIFYVAYAKLFGFATFKYPLNTFKRSWIGIFFLFVNLGYGSLQVYKMLTNKENEYSNTDGKKDSIYIIMISLVIIFIASMIFRMINMLINFVVAKSIYDLINKIEELDNMVRTARK